MSRRFSTVAGNKDSFNLVGDVRGFAVKFYTQEGTWDLAGNLPLHDLALLTNEPLHYPGVSSVSGWVTQRLGGFPREGDILPVGHFTLRVEETRGARVTRLRLVRAPNSPPSNPRDQGLDH